MTPDISPLEIRLTELETRLSLKLDNLIGRFEEVNSGTGFPRCSDRGARLAAAERDIVDLRRACERRTDDTLERRTREVTRLEFQKLEETTVSLRNTLVGVIMVGTLMAFVGIAIKVWMGGA